MLSGNIEQQAHMLQNSSTRISVMGEDLKCLLYNKSPQQNKLSVILLRKEPVINGLD